MSPIARLSLFAVLAAGCMPFHYYPLPVAASDARATFAPIATAASEKGYKFYTWPDSVTVIPDSTVRLTYMFDASGNYVLCVMITDKQAAADKDNVLAAGKMKGDIIWSRAMELRRATMPAQMAPGEVVEPAPGVQIQINH